MEEEKPKPAVTITSLSWRKVPNKIEEHPEPVVIKACGETLSVHMTWKIDRRCAVAVIVSVGHYDKDSAQFTPVMESANKNCFAISPEIAQYDSIDIPIPLHAPKGVIDAATYLCDAETGKVFYTRIDLGLLKIVDPVELGFRRPATPETEE